MMFKLRLGDENGQAGVRDNVMRLSESRMKRKQKDSAKVGQKSKIVALRIC